MECQDMTHRSGYIVNYGKYYLFQPKQLPGPVPVYERRIPSNEIYHSIVVRPEPSVQEINVLELIDTMREQYETATSASSGNDWYSMVNVSKKHILETLAKKGIEIADHEEFNQCIVDHMIEFLLYNQCLELVNYLFFNKLDPFEEMLKSYFKVQKGVLRIWNNTKIVHLRIHENAWTEIFVERNPTLYTSFGTVVGGIVNNDEDERFFKSKSMAKAKTYGQICAQISNKSVAIERIAEVLGINEYTKMDLKNICNELELLLRYLQKLHYENKVWFLSAVEVLEHNQKNTRDGSPNVVNLMQTRNTKK
jgi:hypothetical protein